MTFADMIVAHWILWVGVGLIFGGMLLALAMVLYEGRQQRQAEKARRMRVMGLVKQASEEGKSYESYKALGRIYR